MTTKKTTPPAGELSTKLLDLARSVAALEAEHNQLERREANSNVMLAMAIDSLTVMATSLEERGGYAKGSPLDKAVRQAAGIKAAYEKGAN